MGRGKGAQGGPSGDGRARAVEAGIWGNIRTDWMEDRDVGVGDCGYDGRERKREREKEDVPSSMRTRLR